MRQNDEAVARVRTSIVLSSPSDYDPDEEGLRRRAALQDRAAAFGYLSFSELVRDFADNKIDIVRSRRTQKKEA